MRRKSLLVIGALTLLMVAGGWYWASPLYSMGQLKDAAVSGDAEELEERIDFPKVRESVKSQMRAAMAQELTRPEMKDNPFGALGAMMAMGMVDGLVEGMVTPEGMAAMIEQGKMRRPDKMAKAGAASENEPVEWNIERGGLDSFTATPVGTAGETAPSITFERHGLGWKLADIKIPPAANHQSGS
jgi:hypothetical protein